MFLKPWSNTCGSTMVQVKGTVYDSSRKYPVGLVTVLSTSGKGTITNDDGHYEIEVKEKDCIWFSYLNKPTMKFPVLAIMNPFAFDIALQVNVTVLKEVKLWQRNYRQDSIQTGWTMRRFLIMINPNSTRAYQYGSWF